MSINTSEDYLDELLESIEPIIRMGEPEEVYVPEPESIHETVEIGAEEAVEAVVQDNEPLEIQEDASISDLLSSLTAEEDDIIDEDAMSEEDVEFMLNAVSTQAVLEETDISYDADVKELLKQFSEDEDLSDIQDILDKNDNGEALDNAMLELPDVEVFQLEEDSDEADEEETKVKKANPIAKLVGGFSGLFKKRKNKKEKDSEETEAEDIDVANADDFEEINTDTYQKAVDVDAGLAEMDSFDLGELLGGDELVLDEDMSDIEQLLTGGSFVEEDILQDEETLEVVRTSGKKKSDGKKSKNKKQSFFSRMLNALTEEIDEPDKGGGNVPEADKTGVTQENLNILKELSAEDKKKAKSAKKEEKQKKKAEKKGKNAPNKGENADEEDGKSSDNQKGKKAKKAKKKREKKDKPRKVEVITKPEKKLPRKRVLSTLALCLSILAAILILQNVVFKTDNLKEARYAYDNGDYATCFANLGAVERTEEEEELYQKSMIIMTVQRKWDAYNNYLALGNRVEALNSLLEGVAQYRGQEDLALENGVHAQITVIYQDIMEALQEFGLSQSDVDEILGYESKVTYTKRLDSIVNGTPFVIEDSLESTVTSEPQPLQDVLLGEEDFLPEDTTLINEPQDAVVEPQEEFEVVEETPSSGETVVVGSNLVDVSLQSDAAFYEESVVTGGQNVGNGSTNISSEVTGQNVLIGVR